MGVFCFANGGCKFQKLSFVVLFLFLGSCGTGSENQDKKVFNINLDQGLTSLDPAFARNQNV